MGSFERFRNRNSKRMEARENLNTSFIFKGYPSTCLTNEQYFVEDDTEFITTTTIKATVVSEQEKDKAYIYTTIDDSLDLGSVWGAKGLHWLIAEEIVTIKDVNWHKYLAYLCNIEVEHTWGYFKGPEKNYVNIKNEYGASLESLQKPVLVLPVNILGFEDKIVINKRPWLVQEWDAISSPGIIYYSLRATTISKEVAEKNADKAVYIERAQENVTPIITEPEKQPEIPDDPERYLIGNEVAITLATEDGYFAFSNKQIKIKKRNATSITFMLPFGVKEVKVQTKEGGEVVTRHYVAKE